jgi:hypothetical protein
MPPPMLEFEAFRECLCAETWKQAAVAVFAVRQSRSGLLFRIAATVRRVAPFGKGEEKGQEKGSVCMFFHNPTLQSVPFRFPGSPVAQSRTGWNRGSVFIFFPSQMTDVIGF